MANLVQYRSLYDLQLSYLTALILPATLALAVGYLFVQRLYPQPLPGIPHSKAATKRVFGDIPDIAEYTKKGESFRTWFLSQAHRHNSAITQVFLGPFSKPAVIVSDYREVFDILSHRDAVDFERGRKVDAFRGILPHAFPAMETFDPEFQSSRNLARDLMQSSMLYTVNAPRIYDVICHLLDLWRMKSHVAAGRPFDVSDDIMGPEGGDIKHQHEELAKHAYEGSLMLSNEVGGKTDLPISFPAHSRSTKLAALRVDENSLWKAFVVPWPVLYHRFNNLRPSVRAARRTMRAYIASQIARSGPGLAEGSRDPQCALDFVIQRELRAAAKDGRMPKLADPRILEPIYGYLIAGHDTSSGSLLWLIRRLVAHPAEQVRVRESLRSTYPEAWRARRLPTVTELVRVRSSYLDAFVEETLRCDTPVANIMVMTRYDTVVLGHRVPADTRDFLNLAGPALNQPSVAVAEADRRDKSRASVLSMCRQNWDDVAPGEFRPTRWLKEDVFDSAAHDTLVTAPKHCIVRLRECR